MQSSSVQSSPLQIWKRLEGPRELPRGPRAAGGEAPPLPGGGGCSPDCACPVAALQEPS